MSTEPEALRLAKTLENPRRWHELTDDECDCAAAELRRMHDQRSADLAAMRMAVEALDYMHKEKCDYMTRNKLGDPSRETATGLALPALAALRERVGPTCGRVFNGHACGMPAGSSCPDCGPAVHDFPEGS